MFIIYNIMNMDITTRTKKILTILKKTYPNAHCGLVYKNVWQLLIATILSAQCTDARVNLITKTLFKKYPSMDHFAKASITGLGKDIRSAGLYHMKAKNIVGCCKMLIEKFKSRIPRTIADMVLLPGVGRKTANVVLGNGLGITEGIAVDTHIIRLSDRLGFSRHSDPVKIEQDLMSLFPKKEWTMLSHYLIAHGRTICKAQQPTCEQCTLYPFCPYEQKRSS